MLIDKSKVHKHIKKYVPSNCAFFRIIPRIVERAILKKMPINFLGKNNNKTMPQINKTENSSKFHP